MKRPSLEDMSLAAEWLRANEGDSGESDSCMRVATWLDDQVQQAQVREAAHSAGFKVGDVRRVLARNAAAKSRPLASDPGIIRCGGNRQDGERGLGSVPAKGGEQ